MAVARPLKRNKRGNFILKWSRTMKGFRDETKRFEIERVKGGTPRKPAAYVLKDLHTHTQRVLPSLETAKTLADTAWLLKQPGRTE